jgi:type I restriction enzyme, S subunit
MEQREGYKKTAIGWIPEDWEAKSLGSIGEFLKGKGIAKKDLIEDGIPCVRYGELYTVHHWVLKKFYSFVSSKTASQSTKILKNDILFAGSGETVEEIGKAVSYLGDDEAYAGGDTIILRPENAQSAFLSASLGIESSNKQKRKLGQGNSVVHIYPAGLKKLLVPFPPLPEQNKIASILTTVDDKISSIENQIQQTEQLKKGLMEKLLTEGIGHTEFKETEIGRIPVGWDYSLLSEALETIKNGTTAKQLDVKKGKQVSRIETISNGFIDFEKTGYISDNDNIEGYLLKKGDILFSHINSLKHIGKTAYYNSERKLYHGMNLLLLRTNNNNLSKYIFFLLNSETSRNFFRRVCKPAVNQASINQKEIGSYFVPLPPLPEQKQIATILSTVDDKLDILTQKKSRYQTLKKGLSQQLLTGQMRVKV